MRTFKLTIEYDGTRYSGWQAQANARSIQGELQRAAPELFGRPVEIGGAGRTDAGVHALGQVAHLKFPRWGSSPASVRSRIEKMRLQEILYGLNDRLPSDINILEVADAPHSFHARHDAISRSYLYQISTRRTAFGKKYVWWVKDRLDLRAMSQAADAIAGRHDFSAFSEKDSRREDLSTIVEVASSGISFEEHLILFRITASHFLWKMVRRLAGSLVEAGRGKIDPTEMLGLLEDPSRPSKLVPARVTAPPSGLFLDEVIY